MNAWVAVCLGIAAWFFVPHAIPARRRPVVSRDMAFWRFVTFLAALAFAARWWTP